MRLPSALSFPWSTLLWSCQPRATPAVMAAQLPAGSTLCGGHAGGSKKYARDQAGAATLHCFCVPSRV